MALSSTGGGAHHDFAVGGNLLACAHEEEVLLFKRGGRDLLGTRANKLRGIFRVIRLRQQRLGKLMRVHIALAARRESA